MTEPAKPKEQPKRGLYDVIKDAVLKGKNPVTDALQGAGKKRPKQ